MSGTGASFDVAVVGGGAAGIASALVAAQSGLQTLLFAPPASYPPGRTAALLGGSVALLRTIGVWDALADEAAPLVTMCLVDATRRLLRAPETSFHAPEIGLPAFGYNIPNAALIDALRVGAESQQGLTVVPAAAQGIDPGENSVGITTDVAGFTARLVVAADGARSHAREAAGIRVRTWRYKQAAIVATLAIEHPHDDTSTEFHTERGPFTLVPLPGKRVSLVWVDRPEHAQNALALSDEAFAREVETRARSIHGAMRLQGRPALFPLGAALAERFSGRRTMLVGEAAHLFPPIGAQGLNLGFRDVVALGRVLARHRREPGAPEALAAYHGARQADIRARTLAVDLLNRSLLTDFLPVQAARGIGLTLANTLPPFRRLMMRQGLAGGLRPVARSR